MRSMASTCRCRAGAPLGSLDPMAPARRRSSACCSASPTRARAACTCLAIPCPPSAPQALRRVGAIVEEPRFHPHLIGSGEPAHRRRRARSARRTRGSSPRSRAWDSPTAPRTRSRATRWACASGWRGALPAGRSAAADPRRAHQRPGPGRHPGVPRDDPRDGRAGGAHRLHLLAPARRGRKDLRRRGDRRSRQDHHAGPDRRARRRAARPATS